MNVCEWKTAPMRRRRWPNKMDPAIPDQALRAQARPAGAVRRREDRIDDSARTACVAMAID